MGVPPGKLRAARTAALALLAALAGGCGLKGDLYLPPAAAEPTPPAETAASGAVPSPPAAVPRAAAPAPGGP